MISATNTEGEFLAVNYSSAIILKAFSNKKSIPLTRKQLLFFSGLLGSLSAVIFKKNPFPKSMVETVSSPSAYSTEITRLFPEVFKQNDLEKNG